MNTKLLNYRIIVETEEKQKGQKVYVAYAPTLGISDFGKSVEDAVSHMEEAIKLYIETLIEENQEVPSPDTDDYFVTSRKIQVNMSIPQSR